MAVPLLSIQLMFKIIHIRLNDNKTIWEEISDGQDIITVGKYETSSRAYVGRFNFRGGDQQKKIEFGNDDLLILQH